MRVRLPSQPKDYARSLPSPLCVHAASSTTPLSVGGGRVGIRQDLWLLHIVANLPVRAHRHDPVARAGGGDPEHTYGVQSFATPPLSESDFCIPLLL